MLDMNYEVYTIKDIVQKWSVSDVNPKGSSSLEELIRKRWVYVLKEKLKLSKEEVGWFKMKLAGGREQFVFRAGKRTAIDVYEILEICGARNAIITPSEERTLIDAFVRIIPFPRMEEEIQVCIDMFDIRAYRIEQVIRDYYNGSMVEDIYMKKFFAAIGMVQNPDRDREKRRKFYRDQYERVKRWQRKWMFIMGEAEKIRIAERVECLYQYEKSQICGIDGSEKINFYKTGNTKCEELQAAYREMKKICSRDLCQHILRLFTAECPKDKEIDNGTAESVKNKDGCFNECRLLFSELIGQKLKNCQEDFEYILKEAIKELDTIYKILMQNEEANRRREKALYFKVEILRDNSALSKIEKEAKEDIPKDDIKKGLQNLSSVPTR